ncbi:MAG: FGGY-family carbohydrate kinase [Treponemataceae bacterium]|nr:MAG: FGGY-family carbohydrate kinase [Treponemataceae bacterium]
MIDFKKTALGIELGSTRIKAVLIDENYAPIASGSHDWENRLENGVWTYSLDDVWTGIADAVTKLGENVQRICGAPLREVGSIGISAMMHGYLPFDKDGKQLAPFRTWRNTMTEKAAAALSAKFAFNIPQRWSIAHLYQAMLNDEGHVKDIAFLTTLAGYVHWKLTDKKVLGVGDASGMFPIDRTGTKYDEKMLAAFDTLAGDSRDYRWKLCDILPQILSAGDAAGFLTKTGAHLLDPSGILQAGVPLCPPEGDAGTGMVATNSVSERTGNVSAGTSIFAMIVLEKALENLHTEIDMVTTPHGKPVAMVHCNNCTTDLDAWAKLFAEVCGIFGANPDKPDLYDKLYAAALGAHADCGGLMAYNYYSGEPITQSAEGRPLFVRTPDGEFTLANFMRTLLYSTMATLKIGMDILTEKENVHIERLLGHGGLFKTKEVGQRLMAGALNVPVSVMDSAAEGGAWGIAILAEYARRSSSSPSIGTGGSAAKPQTLENFLSENVFAGVSGTQIAPDKNDVAGFARFMERYKAGLSIEKTACSAI